MTRHLVACALVTMLVPAAASGQAAGADPGSASRPPATLTLDEAIRIALERNRVIAAAALQAARADEDLASARTRRLPAFETSAQTSQLLTPVDFSFPRGAFGEFPGIGPVPAEDVEVTTSRRPNLYLTSQVTQPLSQLHKIGLAIDGAAATADLERERVRERRLSVANAVKQVYFSILQGESALAAADEAITFYREVARTLDARVAQRVALRAEALDVELRLAQEELTRTTRAHAVASQKEQLNLLLGRDVRTPFTVTPVAAVIPADAVAADAWAAALAERPDVREARLKLRQAQIDARLKRAERIPDVSLALSYSSFFNMDVMPKNMAAVGVQVTWDPFDWGRRSRAVAASALAVAQAEHGVREAEDNAIVDVNRRARTLAEARARVRVAEVARGGSRERLRVATNQFQVQSVMLGDLLQHRADLAAAEDRYQQALVAFWSAKAELDLATGEEVIR